MSGLVCLVTKCGSTIQDCSYPCRSRPVIFDSSLPFTSHSLSKAWLSTIIHHSLLYLCLPGIPKPQTSTSPAARIAKTQCKSIWQTETKCNSSCWRIIIVPQELSLHLLSVSLKRTVSDHKSCLAPATSNCCLLRSCLGWAAKEISSSVIIPSH